MDNYKIILILMLINNSLCRTLIEYCPRLPESTLTTILGSAYNPRYMSIEEPKIIIETISGNKRSSPENDFFVDNTYNQKISDKPAWEVNHVPIEIHYDRNKRQSNILYNDDNNNKNKNDELNRRDYRHTFLDSISPSKGGNIFKPRPWECNAQIRWIDLGYEYFPRYIRTVECTKKQCWYGVYTCKARSFTIKVLRRKLGECAKISEKLIMASRDKVTGEFTELWIWEEKAVNFCCDCVMS